MYCVLIVSCNNWVEKGGREMKRTGRRDGRDGQEEKERRDGQEV